MTDPPFGFGPPRDRGGSGDDPGGSPDPMGPLGDPQQFADALRQFADLMSWQSGPVNWDLAKNVARQTVAAKGDPSVLDIERQKVTDAIRVADLWLEDVTSFPTGIRAVQAWSRSEWVEATLPVWSKLCDPIAARAVDAMGGLLAVDPDEVRLFLAMREAAHHRLFAHVPWLRSRLLGAVEDYARGITVDTSALREAMPQIDP